VYILNAIRICSYVPSSKARWVAEILARDIARSVQESMVVQLLTGIVLVDGLATSLEIIHAVLDRVDCASDGIFSDTNRIPESPTQQ